MLNGISAFINVVLIIFLIITLVRKPDCIKREKNVESEPSNTKIIRNVTFKPQSDALGDIVDIQAYPFIASMQNNGRHFCIATVIDKFWVITSSLCVNLHREGVIIRSGSSSWLKGGIIHYVLQSETFKDFGLLRVKQPFQCVPINITTFESPYIFSIPAYTLAWGIYKDKILSEQLRGEEVYVLQPQECKSSKIISDSNLLKDELCASPTENLIDTCMKDPGGPLIQQNVLIGIVIWYEKCGKYGYPTRYANLSSIEFIDWFSKITYLEDTDYKQFSFVA